MKKLTIIKKNGLRIESEFNINDTLMIEIEKQLKNDKELYLPFFEDKIDKSICVGIEKILHLSVGDCIIMKKGKKMVQCNCGSWNDYNDNDGCVCGKPVVESFVFNKNK